MVYHIKFKRFAKFKCMSSPNLLEVVDENDHHNVWIIRNVVEVNPDTPQNRLMIQLKYGHS
jgi:hypothetical protein